MAPCVLVIEDDPKVCCGLREALTETGCRVIEAESGLDALHLLRGGLCPRLILLDVRMHVMDTTHFRLEQRADPRLSTVPVCVVSTASNIDSQAAALRAAGSLRIPAAREAVRALVARYCMPSAA